MVLSQKLQIFQLKVGFIFAGKKKSDWTINTNGQFKKSLLSQIKVKGALVLAMRLCTGRTAHRGSKRIALHFLDQSTRGGEGSASRPGRTLPSGKTRYPMYRRLGRPQGRSGQMRKISTDFDPRTVQPVASRYTD